MPAPPTRYRSRCPRCDWTFESDHRALVEEAALSHAVQAGDGHLPTEPETVG